MENCQSAELKEFVCLMPSYVLWEITMRIQKSPIKFKAISGVFRLVEFLKHIIFVVFFSNLSSKCMIFFVRTCGLCVNLLLEVPFSLPISHQELYSDNER